MPESRDHSDVVKRGASFWGNCMEENAIRERPTAICPQEVILDTQLFTFKSAAVFYDRLFTVLDFMPHRASIGRRGFRKETMACALAVRIFPGTYLLTLSRSFARRRHGLFAYEYFHGGQGRLDAAVPVAEVPDAQALRRQSALHAPRRRSPPPQASAPPQSPRCAPAA